jgi:hypothetical protein
MGFSHSYLESTGTKPKADEIDKAELSINLVDKKIYTKDHNDTVVNIGGSGDMEKSIYDTDDSGIIDNSETLLGYTPASLPVSTATNTALAAKLNITDPSILGSFTEEVYTNTGVTLDPSNGTIQTKALAGDTTFTDSVADGQSMTLMLTNGASYTVTYPTMTWTGGVPTLTEDDVLVFWKVGTTLYGTYVGSNVNA